MLIGYARVSTHDQTLNLQKDALEKIGCTKIFTDTASGATVEGAPVFEISNLQLSGSGEIAMMQLNLLGHGPKRAA